MLLGLGASTSFSGAWSILYLEGELIVKEGRVGRLARHRLEHSREAVDTLIEQDVAWRERATEHDAF